MDDRDGQTRPAEGEPLGRAADEAEAPRLTSPAGDPATHPIPDDAAGRLEARLDALGGAPGASAADHGPDEVDALAALALGLKSFEPLPDPDPAFRSRLAARLQLAPAPSSLTRTDAALAASTGDVIQALDEHLARLRSGASTVHAALEATPEWAAELEPMLNLAVGLQGIEIPGPREDFRRQLRQQLAEAPEPASLRRRRPVAIWRRLWQSSLAMAAVSAVIVMFLTTGLVVASANALPREPLYPVKRLVEQLRVLGAGDEVAMHLHLGFAERRLGEAVIVPPLAGGLLVDFNGQVTAALVDADEALARGITRGRIVQPLIGWLGVNRGRLVDARPGLPPTAWRASLALIDAALLALREGRIVAVAPIPRLTAADVLLARSRWAGVTWQPLPGERVAMAAEGDFAALGPDGLPWPQRPKSGRGRAPGDMGQNRPPAARPVARREPAPIAQPAGPQPISAPPVDQPAAPPVAPPDNGDQPDPGPGESEQPGPANPRPTEPAPLVPTLVPTAMPAPSTPEPTAQPTTQPSPTAVPVNGAPVIVQKPSCDPHVLLVNQSSGCQLTVSDPDNDTLTYEWSVPPIYGEVVPADDRSKAVYHADFNMSGVTKQIVTITVKVRDGAGHTVEDSTDVIVVPFLEQGNHARRPFE